MPAEVKVEKPILFHTNEDESFLSNLRDRILEEGSSDILLSYPVVYLHFWESGKLQYTDKNNILHTYPKFDIYVGESNDVIQRTKEHYDNGGKATSEASAWQYSLIHNSKTPEFIVIGNRHFNKSFTLDVENRLIEYMLAMSGTVQKTLNGRGNPQSSYYPQDEFDKTFSLIWSNLMKIKPDLFVSEAKIKNSSLFKTSPLKKLTAEQHIIKDRILEKVFQAINNHTDHQLIFVQGEAGTGKSVLTTSTFYEIMQKSLSESNSSKSIRCSLLVNHNEQASVYEKMVSRLGFDPECAGKPTSFINSHSPNDKIDVAFIDEGHLLWTQGKQSYRGKNQLKDIMDRARVTVFMFDEYQVLNTEEYWEENVLNEFKQLSKDQGNYLVLENQLRMNCAPSTTEWLNEFILNQKITRFKKDDNKYEVQLFESPADLHQAIEKHASTKGTELSRVVATYDWEYSNIHEPDGKKFWDVHIGNWSMPWNYELERHMDAQEKKSIRHLAWAEQDQTINEVGSTYTIQGFDLSYVGVILGPSVKYRNGKVVFDPSESKNTKATVNRTLSNGQRQSFGETFIRNEVKVLLNRGVNGLYIYAYDDELRKALKTIGKIPVQMMK